MAEFSLALGALRAKQIGIAIAGVVGIVIILAAARFIPIVTDWPWLVPALIAVTLASNLAEVFIIEPRLHRSFQFTLHDDAIEIHRGVLVQSTQYVPYRQVLIVERRVGPVLRRSALVAVRMKLPEGAVNIYGVQESTFDRISAAVRQGQTDG